MTKKTHRFTLYRDRLRHWRWRLTRIRGGKIIADSAEGYLRAIDARRQITTILNLTPESCDFTETR